MIIIIIIIICILDIKNKNNHNRFLNMDLLINAICWVSKEWHPTSIKSLCTYDIIIK